MDAKATHGPLFIVGRPRSGTKLLRQLLNEHPEVSIPTHETHFIVPAIKRFGLQPDLRPDARFDAFFAAIAGSNFYATMQAEGLAFRAAQLRRTADLTSWASIFEVLLKFYSPKGLGHQGIWGDKTPGYLPHIALLDCTFPSARFLHIVRDPRDYCLSMHRVWGRNLLIAAHKWQREVQQAHRSAASIGARYAEVHFEALLSNPEETLQAVCSFLGITFEESMVQLSAPAENLGDATGHSRILGNNQQKYLSQLAPETIQRIEEIVYTTAAELGYEPRFATRSRPLQLDEAIRLSFWYRIAWTRFHLEEKGLRQGLAYLYRSL